MNIQQTNAGYTLLRGESPCESEFMMHAFAMWYLNECMSMIIISVTNMPKPIPLLCRNQNTGRVSPLFCSWVTAREFGWWSWFGQGRCHAHLQVWVESAKFALFARSVVKFMFNRVIYYINLRFTNCCRFMNITFLRICNISLTVFTTVFYLFNQANHGKREYSDWK